MTVPRTITAVEMQYINRSAILEILRKESPVSRTYLAKRLDVSLPTVMRTVDKLIEEELIRPVDETEWSGGRRRALLEFNTESHVVIGVDLGGTKMYVAIADFGGSILGENSLLHHETSGEESYQHLIDLIQNLLENVNLDGRNLRGIGIGAPGITHHEDGIVSWAPSLNWRDFPLKSRLADHFNLPVIVDNDVNLAVLGELWFGVGQNYQNIVLISVGTGIGAGIVIDGALYRGTHQAAGEIGYIIPDRKFLGREYEGFGALESLASGSGIVERAKQYLTKQKIDIDIDSLSTQDVFEAMGRGEQWAHPIIDETVDYLAIAIASVSVLFDPELIVLGGGVSRSADHLIEPIINRIEGAIPITPTIVASSLGRQAAVMGAITSLMHNTDEFYVVRKLT